MKRLALLLLPLAAACTDTPITPVDYDAAFRLCAPHGGLKWVALRDSYSAYDLIRVSCNSSDLIAYMRVDKPKPTPPSTPASGASAP